MKLLCVGCLHGKIPGKLKNKIKKEEFDYVLCSGDLANGDMVRRIIFKNWSLLALGLELEDIIDKKKINIIKRRGIISMDSSIKFLKSLKRPVYLVYGNNDYLNKEAKKYNLRGVEDRIKKSNIKLIKTGILKLGEYKVVGYSGLNSDKQKLYKIYLKAKKPVIFLTHVPARGYHDKVLLKESPMKGMHVGDQNYLKAIKKYKPLIHVSSHMHEHQGKKKLEKTMVVNSGAAFLGRYAIVELENNKVKVVKLVK